MWSLDWFAHERQILLLVFAIFKNWLSLEWAVSPPVKPGCQVSTLRIQKIRKFSEYK